MPNLHGRISEIKTNRIAGNDRYATSAKIAEKLYSMGGGGGSIYIVSGNSYADAISESPLVFYNWFSPILLIDQSVPKATTDYIGKYMTGFSEVMALKIIGTFLNHSY